MTTAIIERVEPTNVIEVTHPTYVIAAEGADAFATGVLQAREAARAAALSAATAESAAGPTYPDTAAGLAATSDGEAFAVDNGDGTVTVWLNDGGVAVEQRTMATTAYSEATYTKIANLASPNGAGMVGVSEVAAPPVQITAAQALSALVRTGKTGIFTTEAEIPDHRAGVLAYRKMTGGQAELLTDLTRFYPEGAFIDPVPEAPAYVGFEVTTWNTTGTTDVHRFIIEPWEGPIFEANASRYAARIIDTATGRLYPTNGYPGTDYTGRAYYNAVQGRMEVEVKMPTGISPPNTIVAYIPYYHRPADALYVDPINGNNLNDGRSFEWPLATFAEAISAAPKVIFCKPGVYDLGNYPGTYTGGDISIRCIGGQAIFVPRPFTFSSWAVHSGSTYVTTVAGSPTPVGAVDLGTLDKFGLPTVLAGVASLAECQATEGTYFYDAAGPRKMYVHLAGGKVPTAAEVMPYSLGILFRHSAPGSKVHISDAIFINGSGGAVGARDADINAVLIAERCYGIGSFNKNGFDILDVGLAISINCIANGNFNDGFNYTAFNGLSPHFIEIGCVGYGNKADGTGNGSTSHDDVRGFRINCDYALNAGPGMADVGTAQSVNVNVTATGSGPNANANGFRAANSAVVVIDGGTAFGNAGSDFAATDSAVIKARDAFGRTQSGTVEAL